MIKCTFENGNIGDLRHAVTNVILLKDNKVLLGKRSMKIPDGGKWGLPGGYMERDETITQAAKREVLEETGWTIKDLTLLDIDDTESLPDDRQNICFCFYASADQKTGEPDWETDEFKWFGFDELPAAELLASGNFNTINKYIELTSKDKPELPLFRG